LSTAGIRLARRARFFGIIETTVTTHHADQRVI